MSVCLRRLGVGNYNQSPERKPSGINSIDAGRGVGPLFLLVSRVVGSVGGDRCLLMKGALLRSVCERSVHWW